MGRKRERDETGSAHKKRPSKKSRKGRDAQPETGGPPSASHDAQARSSARPHQGLPARKPPSNDTKAASEDRLQAELKLVVAELLGRPRPQRLRPSLVLRLHRAALRGLQQDASPGMYRHSQVVIRGVPTAQAGEARDAKQGAGRGAAGKQPILEVVFRPPPSDAVPELLDDFCDEINAMLADSASNPAVVAAFALHRLLWIHPFRDGNGRVSRAVAYLVMCLCLGRDPGLVSLISCQFKQHRHEYVQALRISNATAGESTQGAEQPPDGAGTSKAHGTSSSSAAAAMAPPRHPDLERLSALLRTIWPPIRDESTNANAANAAAPPTDLDDQPHPSAGNEPADASGPSADQTGLAAASEAIREQLECGICAQLMVEPVTASRCGHTFCRLCLKKWIRTQPAPQRSHCRCPMCRKPMGLAAGGATPAVSVTLRNLLSDMFPKEMEEREREVKAEVEENPELVASPPANDDGDQGIAVMPHFDDERDDFTVDTTDYTSDESTTLDDTTDTTAEEGTTQDDTTDPTAEEGTTQDDTADATADQGTTQDDTTDATADQGTTQDDTTDATADHGTTQDDTTDATADHGTTQDDTTDATADQGTTEEGTADQGTTQDDTPDTTADEGTAQDDTTDITADEGTDDTTDSSD